ncbi:MAG: electron transfer flavoprotein subunit beta/FixA family protein [Eubacterium sp.]|nr:electron transfer flavoprotein subunit beta/FixA family protein [Eubacterium sp.]MDD7209701.1 electron transfer flavoprotein subunit beta/FixA family protein [Lachnospiraceae bacterium]MDY5497306.1 electron transfer flavoprotein subunit beta/FixA family protein [Anaerobutyricum sp.]
MNICVCVKQVPDTNEIKVDPVTHTLVRKGVPSVVNAFDTYAQEVGVRLKEKLGGKLIVISMGPEQAKDAIKTCLAVGADGGYLVSSKKFGGSDTLATSYILSEAIKAVEEKEGFKFDLILCGKQATDGDTAQVGPEIAEHLGIPQITYALDIIENDGEIQVKRECDEGYDLISTKLPAVITVVKLPYEPRYPTIKSKMAAKKKEIPVLTEDDIPSIDPERCGLGGSPTKVKKTYTPVTEKNGVVLQGLEPEDAAKQVVKLIYDAKIL